MGVKRINKRRMDDLREELGVKESFNRKLVRSRIKNGRATVDEEST